MQICYYSLTLTVNTPINSCRKSEVIRIAFRRFILFYLKYPGIKVFGGK